MRPHVVRKDEGHNRFVYKFLFDKLSNMYSVAMMDSMATRKLMTLGRFSYQDVAIMPDRRTVFVTGEPIVRARCVSVTNKELLPPKNPDTPSHILIDCSVCYSKRRQRRLFPIRSRDNRRHVMWHIALHDTGTSSRHSGGIQRELDRARKCKQCRNLD